MPLEYEITARSENKNIDVLTFTDVTDLQGGVDLAKQEKAIGEFGRNVIDELKGREGKSLIVDISGIDHVSPKFLGALIDIKNESGIKNIRMSLAGANAPVTEALVLTKLNRKFNLASSVDEAAAAAIGGAKSV